MSRSPELERKLAILMSLAADDREGLPPRLRHAGSVGALGPVNIRHLRPAPGMRMSLLRILMTNACSFNCHYCPMRRDREMPRTLLKPEELVRIFLGARDRGWCEGLFVTTGIPGRPVKVMDDLITALELLRERHRFGGYIHVKLVPGGQAAQIERLTAAGQPGLHQPGGTVRRESGSDRAGQELRDHRVGPGAGAGPLLRERAQQAEGKPRDALHPGGTSGMTMQFVVGATSDTDRSILDTVTRLNQGGGIHHAHFSAFRPIEDTPLENAPATPALREHRLYQADYLLRDYGFDSSEVVFEPTGNLPLAVDPKTAWALAHPERFPIEVRTADPVELMRVPGIGPISARRIVAERRGTRIAVTGRSSEARRSHHAGRGLPLARRPAAPDHAVDPAARVLGPRGGGRRATTWSIR